MNFRKKQDKTPTQRFGHSIEISNKIIAFKTSWATWYCLMLRAKNVRFVISVVQSTRNHETRGNEQNQPTNRRIPQDAYSYLNIVSDNLKSQRQFL